MVAFFFLIFLLGFSIGTSNPLMYSAFLFAGDIEVTDEVTETDPGEAATYRDGKTGSPTGENGKGEAKSSNP